MIFSSPTDQDPIKKTLCHCQPNLRRNYISNKVLFLKMERGIPGVGLWMWRKRKYAIATLILKLHSINHVSQLIFEVINYNQKKIFQYNLKNWSGFTHVRFFFFFFLEWIYEKKYPFIGNLSISVGKKLFYSLFYHF